jgi:hypothetical protein
MHGRRKSQRLLIESFLRYPVQETTLALMKAALEAGIPNRETGPGREAEPATKVRSETVKCIIALME